MAQIRICIRIFRIKYSNIRFNTGPGRESAKNVSLVVAGIVRMYRSVLKRIVIFTRIQTNMYTNIQDKIF